MYMPSRVDLSDGRSPKDWYVCQFDDPTAIESLVTSGKHRNFNDPKSSLCAMANFSMILHLTRSCVMHPEELFPLACTAGVYWKEDGSEIWNGAHHAKCAEFFRSFGFESCAVRNMSIKDMVAALSEGYFVLPSVDPCIRDPDQHPTQKKGHFVLIYRFETLENRKRVFYIQNPAGFVSIASQIGFPVHEDRLADIFSGNYILVKNPQ